MQEPVSQITDEISWDGKHLTIRDQIYEVSPVSVLQILGRDAKANRKWLILSFVIMLSGTVLFNLVRVGGLWEHGLLSNLAVILFGIGLSGFWLILLRKQSMYFLRVSTAGKKTKIIEANDKTTIRKLAEHIASLTGISVEDKIVR
jgi:uncharacterized protein DUF6232